MKNQSVIRLASLLALCTALLAPCFFTACSSTSIDAPEAKLVAKIAVQYAVLKVADKHPDKAAKILEIAREVSAAAGADNANTVDLLVTLIKSKVTWSKLDAADTLLVNSLIDAISTELKARVGTSVLKPEQLLQVKEVADWVIEQASVVSTPAG